MAFPRLAIASLAFLVQCAAQNAFSGVWHLVDALSVICPAGPGHATLTIQKPMTSDYEPHIFTVFRTAQSSVNLGFMVKDAAGKVVTNLHGITLHAAAPYRQLSVSNASDADEADEAPTRALWGMRRRMSSGSRRRMGGGTAGGGGVNLNPMTWFSPRRRTSIAAPSMGPASYMSPRRRISAMPGGTGSTGYSAADGSMRRRGTGTAAAAGTGYSAADGSMRRRGTGAAAAGTAAGGYGYTSFRRRRTNIGGSSSGYSNPYSSYMGSYGYPSSAYAMSAFGGHSPLSTSYGYSGVNAYQGSSGNGMSIALAGGAGLLAGYVGSQMLHPHGYGYGYHHGYNSWGGYTRQDVYGMPCTSGPWSGSCSSCVSLYGASSCNVMMSPKIDATRDDLMSTGFVPSEVVWPITVNVTHLAGPDFNPAAVCPPHNANATGWSPPAMKQLFLTLTSLSQPAASPAYVNHGSAGGASGLINMLMVCCCIGGVYYCSKKEGGPEYQFGGPSAMGPMPGYQGGYVQPAQHQYWQGGGGGGGTQMAQSQRSGNFMSTAAPNGKAWSEYCGRAAPEIGANGSLTGRWAECLAWAVVFEHQDTSWQRDTTASDGPVGGVIDAMIAQTPQSKVQDVGQAAEALEEECRQAIRARRRLPVINELADV